MKIFKLASFGFASAMLVACSDDSGVNTPEGDTLGGIESSSDTGMLDPSGLSSGVLQPGASSAVDLLGVSSSSIAVGPGMSGTGIPMSSSGTLLPTSSAGTPTSSAGFSGNPGSDDTEEDDTVNLNGTETTLTFSAPTSPSRTTTAAWKRRRAPLPSSAPAITTSRGRQVITRLS